MKKLSRFVFLFVVHFAFSLLLNWIFSECEDIVRTIVSSLLFVVIYFALDYFLKKFTKES